MRRPLRPVALRWANRGKAPQRSSFKRPGATASQETGEFAAVR